MRDDTKTAKTLLATIGLTTSDQLWALGKPADESPAAATAAYLATSAAMALTRLDDAERLADQALARTIRSTETEVDNTRRGYTRSADWILQAARQYEEQAAKITTAAETFAAHAYGLRTLLGLERLPTAETLVSEPERQVILAALLAHETQAALAGAESAAGGYTDDPKQIAMVITKIEHNGPLEGADRTLIDNALGAHEAATAASDDDLEWITALRDKVRGG